MDTNFDSDSRDEGATNRRRERCMELAGMFKEKQKGSFRDMERIKALFSLQEGVSIRKATEYFRLIHSAGLLKISNGHKSWVYVREAEWELFKVEI